MIGELTHSEVVALLHQEVVGRIACFENDFIYIVPTSYAFDGSNIYAYSKEGTKINIMRKNPQVCFEVDNVTDMSNWQSVIAWGKFEELKTRALRNEALKLLLDRHLPFKSSITTHLGLHWPFAEDDLDDIKGILFRITIKRKTGKYEHTTISSPVLD